MTIVNSKLKNGTLTIGTTAFSCQAKTVTITPDYDSSGDTVETLCGDQLTPSTTRTDTLKITSVQDFENPEGFIAYTWNNDLAEVSFSWQPSATSPTYSGTIQIQAVEVGGDVNTNLDTDAEFTIIGDTEVTYPTA